MCKFLLSAISLTALSLIAPHVSNAQSPGGIANSNTVWLKANTGSTLSPANQLTNWTEVSGAAVTGDFTTNNPGTGGTTQQPPAFTANGINFNPYINFVSTNPNCVSSSNLVNGNQIFGTQEMTMFQVINLHTSTGTGVWCKWQTSNTAAGRLGDEVNNGGANTGRIRLDYRGGTLYSSGSVLDQHSLYTGMTDLSNNLIIRLSGNQDASTTVFGTNNNSGTARLSLGNENETGGDPYPTTVDIAEFILYNRSLTAAEVNKVESYLAVKYGFTLVQTGASPNDYVASNDAVIWDNSANAPYYNNITGIGLDDYGANSSALHQKQSLSINNDALVTIYNGTYAGGIFPPDNASNQTLVGLDNMSFLLFGDDMGDTTFSVCSNAGDVARIGRVWKVQKTGTLINTVTLTIPGNIIQGAQSLLVSADPTFNTGVTAVPLSSNGSVRYASYNFNSNEYFAFGSAPLALNATINNALCVGQNGSIVLAPTGGVAPYTYSWNTSPPQTTATLSGVGSGSYTVTVTHGNCVYQETFQLDNNPAEINASLSTGNSICTANNGSVMVSGYGGVSPYTYEFDNSGNFISTGVGEGMTPGVHTVTVKDANGCEYDTTFTIDLTEYTLGVSIDTVSAKCDRSGSGGSLTADVAPGSATMPYTYKWADFPDLNQKTIEDVKAGWYDIIITDGNGCQGEATAVVDEIPCCKLVMPNAFSPNGDGFNDEFMPLTNTNLNYVLKVYNRWGQLVYNGYNSRAKGWDGIFDGTKAEAGVYFYTLSYICIYGDEEYLLKGDVTLIR